MHRPIHHLTHQLIYQLHGPPIEAMRADDEEVHFVSGNDFYDLAPYVSQCKG